MDYTKSNFANQFKSEDDFRRGTTKVEHEYSSTVIEIHKETGEIIPLKEHTEKSKIISQEPDFIKIYYKAMMAVYDCDELPLTFLLALSSHLSYANGNKMLFFNNITNRRTISNYCEIGDNMVLKYIKRCVEKGILFKTEDRGTYEVNPWLIAKGKWENIRELQANFRFVDGKWERIIEMEDNEANE